MPFKDRLLHCKIRPTDPEAMGPQYPQGILYAHREGCIVRSHGAGRATAALPAVAPDCSLIFLSLNFDLVPGVLIWCTPRHFLLA